MLIALYHQASHVTGVDVSPLTVEAITGLYNDYAGGYFTRPDVTIVAAEGRHFLSRDRGRYDVIQLSGVDTFTALSSGAYALTENYLYTVEAMQDYWDHLTPDGVLSFSRWSFVPPRETLRLVALMAEALENRGVSESSRHVVVVAGHNFSETLMKRSPFAVEEVAVLAHWAQENEFDMVYAPFQDRGSEYDALLRSDRRGREEFYQQYVYNVVPSTDDQPFFFDYYKWSSLFGGVDVSRYGYPITRLPWGLATLLLSLLQIVVLAAIGIFYPLRRLRQGLFARPGRWAALAYFGALGLGYDLLGRGLLAIALLAPLALVMGMPFPLGVRILGQYSPDWIPWAWAVNSFTTVFGSLFCILLSMALGFRWVLIIAGLVYLGGFLSFGRLAVCSARETA